MAEIDKFCRKVQVNLFNEIKRNYVAGKYENKIHGQFSLEYGQFRRVNQLDREQKGKLGMQIAQFSIQTKNIIVNVRR